MCEINQIKVLFIQKICLKMKKNELLFLFLIYKVEKLHFFFFSHARMFEMMMMMINNDELSLLIIIIIRKKKDKNQIL